jgi:transposase-like protein
MSHRINANLVRRWIVRHRSGRPGRIQSGIPTLLPVTLSAPRAPASLARADCTSEPKHASSPGVIEIELASARVRVRGAVDGAALRVVLDALVQR